MDFHVVENTHFDVIVGVPALEVLQGRLDFGFKQLTTFGGDRRATLPCIYIGVKGPTDYGLDRDSGDLTFDSDATLDED